VGQRRCNALAPAPERSFRCKRSLCEASQRSRSRSTCFALRYRNEAERELRKLGHSIHRRTRPGKSDGIGVASLTERELEIARLVVDRKTNAEIAAALFLSPKTIETHMRNIFRKLNVFSRVDVARAVERAEGKERALSQ
jgi:DNA-binding CsgD family transcriptional regulator